MEKLKVRAYLAGWSKELEYRRYAKENFGDRIDFEDPMTITFSQVRRDIGENCWKEYLVTRDKKMILKCDILIAYVNIGPTWGTTMEIMFAYERGIPVYMIDPNEEFRHDAWVAAHINKAFSCIDDCCEHILGNKI